MRILLVTILLLISANAYAFSGVLYGAAGHTKLDQTITLTDPTDMTVGDADQTITCSATSGLACALSTNNASYCTIVAGKLHAVGVSGTNGCILYADQAGNASWNAAPQVNQTVTISVGGVTPTYYYSAGGSATSYTTCDDTPTAYYHNGNLVTAGQTATVTSFGVKVFSAAVHVAQLCMYNATGTTRLGCCKPNTPNNTADWMECTSQSIAVTASTQYLILTSDSDGTMNSCRCAGGSDCALGTGKYTTDYYNAAACTTGCVAPVGGLGNDTANTTAVGVRIYVQ